MKPSTRALVLTLALTLIIALTSTPLFAHGNPRAEVAQTVGHNNAEARINYSRPRVKGRTIWGDLVPYDKPWRTGADRTTTLTVSAPLKVNGQEIPAGTYGLFTIPGRDGWSFIISKQSQMMGLRGYDPAQDVLRVEATTGTAQHVEFMEFSFENVTDASADITLRWGDISASFKITE